MEGGSEAKPGRVTTGVDSARYLVVEKTLLKNLTYRPYTDVS